MKLEINKASAFLVGNKEVDVNFKAISGKINLIIGENGCGKSSFLSWLKVNRSLMSSLVPSFMDQKRLESLTDLGVDDVIKIVEEETTGKLSVEELQVIYGIEIENLKNKKVSELSGGQNQRLKLALCLLEEFDVLFLDEPLQSLDQANKSLFLNIIKSVADAGKMVVMVEHQYSDINGREGLINRFIVKENKVEMIHD